MVEKALLITGAQEQNRTADTGIFSPLLYRLSYLGSLKNKAFICEFRDCVKDYFCQGLRKDAEPGRLR